MTPDRGGNGVDALTALAADWSTVDRPDDRLTVIPLTEPSCLMRNETTTVRLSSVMSLALGWSQFELTFP